MRRQVPQALAETAALGAATWVAYHLTSIRAINYQYIVFMPLLWIAARYGFERAVVAVSLFNVGVAFLAWDRVQGVNSLALQFGLMTATLSGVLLGAFVTERQLAQETLRRHAFRDALTGLPNRALFLDRLGHALERSRQRGDYLCAVLFLDLDRFKVINDSLGHTAGDRFLIDTARRLSSCLRPVDTEARLGGDEFTVLLEDIGDEGDAVRVAERILAELNAPLELDGREVSATVSIGIVLMSAGSYDRPEEAVRDADIAMYRAKAAGRSCYQIFGKEMHIRAVALLELETDLRRAVEREEFRVHYQPIVSLPTGRISGFEALVRWQHPQRGLLLPAAFLPLAEETGLILPLGRWVLAEACRQTSRWQRRFPQNPPLTVSVNLAIRQFTHPDLVETIAQSLRQADLGADSLKLEITESGIMEDGDVAASMLAQLRAMGVSTSVDDFGTGHSSLSRLHSLPLDALKIDRSFIHQMSVLPGGSPRESETLVEAIVTLAHGLCLAVVAEGVETAAQLATLRKLGCQYGQGYFFSRPVDDEAATILLES